LPPNRSTTLKKNRRTLSTPLGADGDGRPGGHGLADSSQDWARIVDRLLAGDRLAFLQINRLISRFLAQQNAYDFADEWDDLRQEVMCAIVESARAGRLRDPRKFVAYVRIVTRNKFVDRLGRGGKRAPKDAMEWDERAEAAAEKASGDGSGDREAARDLWIAVRGLSDEHRRVLVGVYGQGKTYQQVADEAGMSLSTLKRRLGEGLSILRERLGADDG